MTIIGRLGVINGRKVLDRTINNFYHFFMGLDYRLLFVYGAEVNSVEKETTEFLPSFHPRTGVRLKDEKKTRDLLYVHDFKPVQLKHYQRTIDKETIPELGEFYYFVNGSVIGKIVGESELVRAYNTILREIPNISWEDKEKIKEKLKQMKIAAGPKMYAILDVSY